MAKSNYENIKVEPLGIGTVLQRGRLEVPVNQRDYSWEEEHVNDLFQDLQKAVDTPESSYFLGAIALTGTFDRPEITDGQQRLATTTILLAAMRDHFHAQGDEMNVRHLEGFLSTVDPDEGRYPPRLTLNVDDREFFRRLVCHKPNEPERDLIPTRQSHRLMLKAAEIAAKRVKIIISGHASSNQTKRLRAWIKFIEHSAIVIVLRMPDDMNAFQMFETLNDRGRKTTQLDIVKNYLFLQVGEDKHEAQPVWSKMIGLLETLEMDDVELTFLRHAVTINSKGLVRSRGLYEKIEKSYTGRTRATEFMELLAGLAAEYVALLSPDSKKWNDYPAGTRNHLKTLLHLRVVPIRPILLAIAKKFDPQEAEKAFRYCISVVVRFLVFGSARGEAVEESYALRSQEIMTGAVKTAKDLAKSLVGTVPTDPEFETAFQTARVSKSYLARYYLRALEMKVKGCAEPEWVPNDETVINLEHVLPESPEGKWPDVHSDDAASCYNRIGNMVLLQASKNSIVGNACFDDKKPTLKASAYLLTSDVAKSKKWGKSEIDARQKKLAELAVKTWTIVVN